MNKTMLHCTNRFHGFLQVLINMYWAQGVNDDL